MVTVLALVVVLGLRHEASRSGRQERKYRSRNCQTCLCGNMQAVPG